jgi:hypothetical protein
MTLESNRPVGSGSSSADSPSTTPPGSRASTGNATSPERSRSPCASNAQLAGLKRRGISAEGDKEGSPPKFRATLPDTGRFQRLAARTPAQNQAAWLKGREAIENVNSLQGISSWLPHLDLFDDTPNKGGKNYRPAPQSVHLFDNAFAVSSSLRTANLAALAGKLPGLPGPDRMPALKGLISSTREQKPEVQGIVVRALFASVGTMNAAPEGGSPSAMGRFKDKEAFDRIKTLVPQLPAQAQAELLPAELDAAARLDPQHAESAAAECRARVPDLFANLSTGIRQLPQDARENSAFSMVKLIRHLPLGGRQRAASRCLALTGQLPEESRGPFIQAVAHYATGSLDLAGRSVVTKECIAAAADLSANCHTNGLANAMFDAMVSRDGATDTADFHAVMGLFGNVQPREAVSLDSFRLTAAYQVLTDRHAVLGASQDVRSAVAGCSIETRASVLPMLFMGNAVHAANENDFTTDFGRNLSMLEGMSPAEAGKNGEAPNVQFHLHMASVPAVSALRLFESSSFRENAPTFHTFGTMQSPQTILGGMLETPATPLWNRLGVQSRRLLSDQGQLHDADLSA